MGLRRAPSVGCGGKCGWGPVEEAVLCCRQVQDPPPSPAPPPPPPPAPPPAPPASSSPSPPPRAPGGGAAGGGGGSASAAPSSPVPHQQESPQLGPGPITGDLSDIQVRSHQLTPKPKSDGFRFDWYSTTGNSK